MGYTPSEIYYMDSSLYHYAYIDTDEPYDAVDWAINDADSDRSHKITTWGDGVKTRAWFYPDVSDCPGHIKGKKYRITAKVWYRNDDGNGWSDWESRDSTVFQSISTTEVEDPPKRMRNIYGYSELTRQYYTGDAIKIDCWANAYNPFETNIRAWSRFKHSLTGRNTKEKDDPIGINGLEPKRIGGEYGSYSHSDTLTHININLRGNSYDSGAYVRLVVQGNGGEDHYLVDNFETFNFKDKPYDAPDE